MLEIRTHGRGGQGGVTSMELLAVAAFKEGKFSQAFPSFGVARRGAPVEAFCRINDKYIDIRSHVYHPKHVIILDETLLRIVDVKKGLLSNGTIILNSREPMQSDFNVYRVDATKIAVEVLGRPIVNTAMLGAFAKATKAITIESLEKAIEEKFPEKLTKINIEAMRRAYEECEKVGE